MSRFKSSKSPSTLSSIREPHDGEEEDVFPSSLTVKQTAELLMSALDSTGEMVALRGRGGHVIHVNQAFLNVFGGNRTDWVGRWFSE